MGTYAIKMPDIGEGVAEAELVEWAVKLGDEVREDAVLAAVMTDKATVEVPSHVSGKVTWLGGEVGDLIGVGAELVRLEILGEGNTTYDMPPSDNNSSRLESAASENEESASIDMTDRRGVSKTVSQDILPSGQSTKPATTSAPVAAKRSGLPVTLVKRRAEGERPLASPSVRQRALDAGVDLRRVIGCGPTGRIQHEDIDAYLENGDGPDHSQRPNTNVEDIKLTGLRRKIAERMSLSKSRIADATIVEEIDVTELEKTRAQLNAVHAKVRGKLTMLPFVITALVRVLDEYPQFNATYDDDAGVIRQYGGVHAGIGTQTPAGLVVAVIRHAETLGLWEIAAEIARLAEAARSGSATRQELSGSTISVSSLGPYGGIATTPVINFPEVAIIGINSMSMRPVWDGAAFQPRRMMNISCSFDHRVIDGWDVAMFVQMLKRLLELPTTIFVR